jgi:CBS domain-containing protein
MIRGLIKTDVCTVTPEKTVKEAATLMRDRNIGDVVVVDSNQSQKKLMPIGILTDRDIVCACVANDPNQCSSMKVADVMSKNVTFVKEDAGLFDAIRTMRQAGVGRILVVDNNRCLLGILTANTIFDLLNEELHELGQIARAKRPNAGQAQAGAMGSQAQATQTQPSYAH